jgi:hypothetical protein
MDMLIMTDVICKMNKKISSRMISFASFSIVGSDCHEDKWRMNIFYDWQGRVEL